MLYKENCVLKLIIATNGMPNTDIQKFAHILSSYCKCYIEEKKIIFDLKYGTSQDIKMVFNPIIKKSIKRLETISSKCYTDKNIELTIV